MNASDATDVMKNAEDADGEDMQCALEESRIMQFLNHHPYIV